MELWAKAGVTIDTANPPAWYVSAGSGMLATLQVAAEKKAYTLTDVATWIKNKTSASLSPPLYRLLTTRKDLKNQYSVLLVNQTDHPDVNATGAEFLAEWLVSRNGQEVIGDYKMLEHHDVLSELLRHRELGAAAGGRRAARPAP